ncbi:MAG TPA: hypothetical protein VFR99_04000 [Marmoricola sp.]|nr:hypothetical protein [Marmoricola sp.]
MTDLGDETKLRYPVLDVVLTSFYQCRNDDLLDPIAAIDEGVDNARGRGKEAAEDFRRLLADEPDPKQLGRRLSALGLDEWWFLPGDLHAQCRLAARRMESYPLRGREYVDASAGPLERASRWISEKVGERAVRRTLERYRGELELWTSNQGGLPRVCLGVDLGEELGWATVVGEEGDQVARSCVVVVEWDEVQPTVKASYPDRTWDSRWRQALPDLVHVFGGYFGQHTLAEFRGEWDAFGAVMRLLGSPARARVAAQLAQLLTLPEPEAKEAVRNLGSYVVPPDTLGWIERLHWVLAEIDAGS